MPRPDRRCDAKSDENTNTVPAGRIASNGTHSRNAAQSATNAAHHRPSAARSRNGRLAAVGACTDSNRCHTSRMSSAGRFERRRVGIPAIVVLPYSTMPMVTTMAPRRTRRRSSERPNRDGECTIDARWATITIAASCGKKLPVSEEPPEPGDGRQRDARRAPPPPPAAAAAPSGSRAITHLSASSTRAARPLRWNVSVPRFGERAVAW